MVKNLPASGEDIKKCGFNPWVRKIPWRREWLPTLVLLLGESHGQRSLAATAHRVAESRPGLKQLSTHAEALLVPVCRHFQSQCCMLGSCKGRVHFQISVPILALYCHVTKHPKTYWLKATIYYYLSFFCELGSAGKFFWDLAWGFSCFQMVSGTQLIWQSDWNIGMTEPGFLPRDS